MGERKWLWCRYFIKSREKRTEAITSTSHLSQKIASAENICCPMTHMISSSSEVLSRNLSCLIPKEALLPTEWVNRHLPVFFPFFSSLCLECNCQLEKMEQPAREGKTDNRKPSMAEHKITKPSPSWNDQINLMSLLFVHLCNIYFTWEK